MSTDNAGDNPVRGEDETVGNGRTEDLGSSRGSVAVDELIPYCTTCWEAGKLGCDC